MYEFGFARLMDFLDLGEMIIPKILKSDESKFRQQRQTKMNNSIPPNTQIILFDGVCNFCNASINFIIDHDPKKYFKFAPLQSDLGQEILKQFNKNIEDFDSVILLKDNQLYQKSEAAIEITKHLSGAWKYLSFFGIFPAFFLNFFYDIVAKNRYKVFGKTETCRMPTPELRERFLQ